MPGSNPESRGKIYIFNYEFPPLGGGAGKASFWLAVELVKKGFAVKVITSRFRGFPFREEIQGVEVWRIPVIRKKIHQASVFEMCVYIVSSIVSGVHAARRDRPDISLAFFSIPSGIAAFVLKKLLGIPYFILLRGGDVPGFYPRDLGRYHRITRPLIHGLWKQADGVIANSDGLKRLARRSMPGIDIQVVPNGVDPELFQYERRKDVKIGAVRILFAGRFSHHKGIDVLLESLNRLSPDIHEVEVDLVGDGPEMKRLKQKALEISGRVQINFYGWKSREDLYRMYRDADLFVFPSRDEGMPNVILEAMASGLPVIATRIPGSEELVADGVNGFLVHKDDPNELRRALEKLINEPELRQKMALKGKEKVMNYSWDKVVSEYIRVLGLQSESDRVQWRD